MCKAQRKELEYCHSISHRAAVKICSLATSAVRYIVGFFFNTLSLLEYILRGRTESSRIHDDDDPQSLEELILSCVNEECTIKKAFVYLL